MATADDDAPDIEECLFMQKEEFEVLEVCTLKAIVFRSNRKADLVLL
jgi:hypothetical protein